jgi:hypothetical protein
MAPDVDAALTCYQGLVKVDKTTVFLEQRQTDHLKKAVFYRGWSDASLREA